MKSFICVYCEGSDTKIAVLSQDKEGIKIQRTLSARMIASKVGIEASSEQVSDLSLDDMSSDISFEGLGDSEAPSGMADSLDVNLIAAGLSNINLKQTRWIPILTEPNISYHIYEGNGETDKNKLIDSIIKDIHESKKISVNKDSIDCIRLNEKSYLCVFVEGEIPCVNMIYSLAQFNKRRYYRISAIKSAEISLAYYVSKTTKFFPEDFSLIIYIGKEYSKLIFLEGQKLKHIGSTLDIGTQNLHTYDVYFSKILLEMENGGIPRLDNVILCGEDRSENLILSFYGSFPEANVSELKFDKYDLTELSEDSKEELSAFAIPIAGAMEHFDEINKEYTGINILPRFIQENQKILQFGWHSYILLPLLFAATFFFTFNIQSNFKEMNDLDKEIARLTQLREQNRIITEQMTPIMEKIANFDNTQSILDSATAGTEFWSNSLDNFSDFGERRRNYWVTKLETIEDSLKIEGISLSRSVLSEFTNNNEPSMLRSVLWESMRENVIYKYTINLLLKKRKGWVYEP